MNKCVAGFGLIATLLSFAGVSFGQAEDKESSTIIEIGGGELSLKDGGSSFGTDFGVEVTPIEDWLELEAGVSPMFSHGLTEWETDFLFKKPFTLSENVEFMVGVGPEWDHVDVGGETNDSVSGEAVLDFMFWPWVARKFGLYLEPSYGYNFGVGHEQSLAVSGGLLIPIP